MVWVVSLSTTEVGSRSLTAALEKLAGIRSLIGFGRLVGPLVHSVLYHRQPSAQGYTSIYFGENQLSPGLISLSLLSPPHPSTF